MPERDDEDGDGRGETRVRWVGGARRQERLVGPSVELCCRAEEAGSVSTRRGEESGSRGSGLADREDRVLFLSGACASSLRLDGLVEALALDMAP